MSDEAQHSHNPHGVVVGHTLWFVPFDPRRAIEREVTITKVGRKYAEAGPHWRFILTDLTQDGRGWSSAGALYVSRAAYEHHRDIRDAWMVFRNTVNETRDSVAQISPVRIAEIAEELGILADYKISLERWKERRRK